MEEDKKQREQDGGHKEKLESANDEPNLGSVTLSEHEKKEN